MTARRAIHGALEALAALTAACALYIWLVGPIDFALSVRPHWKSPSRLAALSALLLVARLLAPWAERNRARWAGPIARAVKSPYAWLALALMLIAGWLYSGHLSREKAIRAAVESASEGSLELGLVTRPVLDPSKVSAGVLLEHASPGDVVEIACGLSPAAARFAGLKDGKAPGRVLLSSRGAAGTELGRCEMSPGRWCPMSLRLPPDYDPAQRLVLDVDAPGAAGLSAFVHWTPPRILPSPDPSRPNLIVISLDTLRADHLGAYGYTRPVSPNIDRLARQGTLFEQAMSQSSWTTPSHMSLFTSLYPTVHAVDMPTRNVHRPLTADKTTLADVLSKAGYMTAAFTGSGAISAINGFWRGFDLYDETDLRDPARGGEDISGVFQKASRWLVSHGDRPFFMFFHSYEVHAPYTHTTFLDAGADVSNLERVTARYDSGIFYADGFVGQLMRLLDGLGIKERTIVVFLSDHGEELDPRYPGKPFGHGHTMYNELLHVPLIIVAPGRVPAGLRVHPIVQIIDVMPTILEIMGLDPPEGIQGKSLTGTFRGEAPPDRYAFAECTNFGPERKAIRDARFKYIEVFPRTDRVSREIPVPVPPEEFFDLQADPDERHSILDQGGPDLDRLRSALHALVKLNASLRKSGPEKKLDEKTLEQLKALGYVN